MDDSRRQFIRVSADCPILYRVIQPDDPIQLETDHFDPISSIETHDIASNLRSEGEHRDDRILELLLWIDWKVNYLIKERSRDKDRTLFPYEAVMVDLSGSGMRFSSHRKEEARTLLQFRLILPILPFKEMTFNGEVVHLRKKKREDTSPRYEIGVEYSDIKETDRESLFRYIVKRERQIRYDQREQNGKGITT